jgi:nucleoside-diphosphate-sugar epimerase
MTPTLDPNQFIDPAVKRIRSLLRTAANQPTVKSFVLTSSSSACTTAPNTNIVVLDKDTWNEQSVEQAYSLPDSHPMKPWQIYSASKTLVEQAAWKFVKEENPGFILNTVLPCANFGPILDSKQTASTAGWVRDAYTKGDITFLVCPRKSPFEVHLAARIDRC